jgi:hypothetical protein
MSRIQIRGFPFFDVLRLIFAQRSQPKQPKDNAFSPTGALMGAC